jgi:hypothetical protein
MWWSSEFEITRSKGRREGEARPSARASSTRNRSTATAPPASRSPSRRPARHRARPVDSQIRHSAAGAIFAGICPPPVHVERADLRPERDDPFDPRRVQPREMDLRGGVHVRIGLAGLVHDLRFEASRAVDTRVTLRHALDQGHEERAAGILDRARRQRARGLAGPCSSSPGRVAGPCVHIDLHASMMDKVIREIEKRRDGYVGELAEFLAIPSVATDPDHAGDVPAPMLPTRSTRSAS